VHKKPAFAEVRYDMFQVNRPENDVMTLSINPMAILGVTDPYGAFLIPDVYTKLLYPQQNQAYLKTVKNFENYCVSFVDNKDNNEEYIRHAAIRHRRH